MAGLMNTHICLFFLNTADGVQETELNTDYCPFDIICKDVFAWHFILNENILF